MTNKIYYVTPFIASLLLGCSSDKNAATPPPDFCTKDFVKSYNQVVKGISATTELWDSQQTKIPSYWMTDILILDRSCQNFYTQHAGISCMADLEDETLLITSQNLTSYCQTAQELSIEYKDISDAPPAFSSDTPFDEDTIETENTDEDFPEVVIEEPTETRKDRKRKRTEVLDESLPETPDNSENIELLPVPNASKVPNGTLPSLKVPAEKESSSSDPLPESSPIDVIPPKRIKIVVENAESVRKILENREIVISEGVIDSLQSPKILEKVQKGAVFCSLTSLQKDMWLDKLSDGMPLSVMLVTQIKEGSQSFQQLTLSLEDERTGLSLSCLKRSQESFRLEEISKTLKGVLDIKTP